MSNGFIPELSCESLIRKVCGPQWRHSETDGGFGVAIVKSVLDGVNPDLDDVSEYLCIDKNLLLPAFRNLHLNGIFFCDRIINDKALRKGDLLAWCYYAGFASGATGTVIPPNN